ncbi:uncharacterized protein si:ch211-14c7.2 isoform X2 [Osmerus eperlanus]|uniref:uncharacterized protein si:ch211-14c7.2 isoform X2 n=1 Tax=Osmerus eperlanus TaxID=29151 RepID=UPI002E0EDF34
MRPTAMLQQNNNNNYPCLDMAASPRPAVQQCPKASLPFGAGRLELGDIPLVRGLRAWALCSKNRRRTPAPSSCAPGLRPVDLYPAAEWGRLGYGLGLPPLDSRQAGLGALVTVATLKASEGGGQTQTRCLVVRTEGGRCLYSTATSQGRHPQESASTLVGGWLKERVAGGANAGRTANGERGGAQGACRIKLRHGRRWRTSCRPPAAPLSDGTFQNVPEEQELGALPREGKQEEGDKASLLRTDPDGQRGRQDRGGSRSPRSNNVPTQSSSRCPRRHGGQGSRGGGAGQGGSEGATHRQSGDTVDSMEQQEEEAREGTGRVGLTGRESSAPPSGADLEPCSPVAEDQNDTERSDSQRELSPQTSLHTDLQEEKTKEEPTGAEENDPGSCSVFRGTLRDSRGLEEGANWVVDHVESEKEPEGMDGAERQGLSGLDECMHVRALEKHHCTLASTSAATLSSGPAEGSTFTAELDTRCELIEKESILDVVHHDEIKHCVKYPPHETDPVTEERERVDDDGSELLDAGVQSTSPEVGDPCNPPGETPCKVTDDEVRPMEVFKRGHVTAYGLEGEAGQEKEFEEEKEEELEAGRTGRTGDCRKEIEQERSGEESQLITEEKESHEESRPEELNQEKESDEESRPEELNQEKESDEDDQTEELNGKLEALVEDSNKSPGREFSKEVIRTEELEEFRPGDTVGELGMEERNGDIEKECRPEEACPVAPPAALIEEKGSGERGWSKREGEDVREGEVERKGEGQREVEGEIEGEVESKGVGERDGEAEVDSVGQSCNTPSLGPVALGCPATFVTNSPHNPPPLAVMATGLPCPEGVREAEGGASAELQNAENREHEQGSKVASVGGSVERGQEEEEEEEEEEDDFGLFMQAGEQSSWEDGFVTSPPVPCGNGDSAALENHLNSDESAHWTSGWTDSSVHQSEETWTAFPNDPVGLEGRDAAGQWWPSCAEEETGDRQPTKQDLNTVFREVFPCLPSSSVKGEVVPTLTQLLRGVPAQPSPAEDLRLLDGFHDLNKMIGWRYKRANAVSCELLLQSLHLDQHGRDYISGIQSTNHSPSLRLPSSNQYASTTGKRWVSYDHNKNIME